MSQIPSPDELIATAMQLPLSDRVAIASAMLNSIDTAPDLESNQDEINAAWDAEIGRRVDDVESGRVKTVPSSEVWKRIGGKPSGRT